MLLLVSVGLYMLLLALSLKAWWFKIVKYGWRWEKKTHEEVEIRWQWNYDKTKWNDERRRENESYFCSRVYKSMSGNWGTADDEKSSIWVTGGQGEWEEIFVLIKSDMPTHFRYKYFHRSCVLMFFDVCAYWISCIFLVIQTVNLFVIAYIRVVCYKITPKNVSFVFASNKVSWYHHFLCLFITLSGFVFLFVRTFFLGKTPFPNTENVSHQRI